MGLMLRHLHGNLWQFDNLVPARLRIVGARRAETVGVPEPYLWVAKESTEQGRAAAEKVAVGSFTPTSVPATLAV